MIGATLGHYRVLAKLGEGGMGEVWRAEDTRLGREVAIKLLPTSLADEADRLARFEREARVLAALNHPNVASIYGLEEAQGQPFLVMELAEGETLEQRLARGPLPTRQALEVARGITLGLEAAHQRGIVHRDLKPANVMLGPDDGVKVLDFGLAKAIDPDPDAASPLASDTELNQSPTLALAPSRAESATAPLVTGVGTLMGTASYMSPEQARARPADRRSDIWSFGCLLFEMLTGRRLFGGSNLADVLAAVLAGEIDLQGVPAETPPSVRRLLRRCLVREPRDRLHDMADARLDLDDALRGEDADLGDRAATGHEGRSSPARTWAMRVALVLLALTSAALLFRPLGDRREPGPAPVVRATLLPPPGTEFHLDPWTPGPPAISPDGLRVTFVARDDEVSRLYVRELGALEPRPLAGTEGARYPFWSPDGRNIAFFDGASLKRVAATGAGLPIELAAADNGKGGAWAPDGTIIYTPNRESGLFTVPSDGGEAKPLFLLEGPGDASHRHPRMLPDGRSFLFVLVSTGRANEIRLGSLDGRPPIPVIESPAQAEFVGGRLLYVRGTTLLAQPFDPSSGQLSGTSEPLLREVALLPQGAGFAVFSTSTNGSIVYQSGALTGLGRRLRWRDRAGNELGLLGEQTDVFAPRLSPDGRRVAVGIAPNPGNWNLSILDLGSDLRQRLTTGEPNITSFAWSPDSTELAIVRERADSWEIHTISTVTGEESPVLVRSEDPLLLQDWTEKGDLVLVRTPRQVGGLGAIGRVPVEGGEIEMLLSGPSDLGPAVVSPNGRWIAYQSEEAGFPQIYVTTYPAPGPRYEVSTGEGRTPMWRRDGGELFFSDGTSFAAARIDSEGDRFSVLAVEPLFSPPDITSLRFRWAADVDGERFLLLEPVEEAPTSELTLLLNGLDRLEDGRPE